MSQNTLFYVAAGVAAVLLLLQRVTAVNKHSSEPPFVPTRVPFFGHLFGVLFEQTSYYARISKQYSHKLYSLAMPGGRVYIVNSPDYISTIQKNPRELSFWFIEASLTKNLGGISDKANAILLENARGDKGSNSLVVDGMKATHKAMAGEALDTISLAAINRAKRAVNESINLGGEIELWDWAQHVFSLAVSSSVYGPENPYENERLTRSLTQFADHTPTFLTGLPAWLFIPKAYKAREAIVARFQDYFAKKADTQASELVKARAKVLREYGIPEPDIARFEAVNGFGILLNLLPTAFWTLWHVLSDPALLSAVRAEALAAGLAANADCLPASAAELKKLDKLPLLTSVMKEAMRHHGAGVAARMVMNDHMLDNKFLLKRDSYVFIPNAAMHFDRASWGANVDTFVADRFTRESGEKIHPAAFRGFGGGVNLCPGRAYSLRLITGVVAAVALRFEGVGVEGWKYPGHDERSMAITLARPLREVRVRFSEREVAAP
ncbi:cytochrome P450 [Karstenula rhodostoma CBS 690.94]|uniref:Cytochrome P450 n=1 Tax=Karstenula rhodostoma CBS 690.94 TaxID=1392251 RepID=A0A9P4UF29_9PLEO|nr:cytochrome P450 [Karstenula rhodostoma CBS 690.94]